jgi:hypothetical protein
MTELVASCMGLLADGGKIFLSVNMRRQAVTAAGLETELRVRLAPNAENLHVTDLSDKVIDEDFRGKKTPKAFLIMNNALI